MTARLSFVGLAVRDLEASIQFYGDVLGLPVRDDDGEQPFRWIGGPYSVVATDDVVLALFPAVEAAATSAATLGFTLPDLEAVHERAVATAASVYDELRDTQWGRRAMYHDPDGHVVVVTEPL